LLLLAAAIINCDKGPGFNASVGRLVKNERRNQYFGIHSMEVS
jgi:hypothetical protein